MGEYNISQIIHNIKRNFSRDVNKIILNQPIHPHNIPKFKWQKSYRDHIVRDESDLRNHQRYVWYNPVKHGLCIRPEDYKWTYIKARDF